MEQTLGVLAHRGGLIAEHPQLTVGVLRAVSRPGGLELELMARRPLDRRGPTERQADIRAGRTGPAPAPRNLLPPYDEGLDLRVGRLDEAGHAHWVYPRSTSSFSGDHAGGTHGPTLQTLILLPPVFDRLSLVLAWPEIGFPETVVDLPLPSRATVHRDTVSIWDAPVHTSRPPETLRHRAGVLPATEPEAETGRIIAGPRVLARCEDAVVVLNRLTETGDMLSFELGCLATVGIPHDMSTIGGAAVAVVRDDEAVWAEPHTASAGGGDDSFVSAAEYAVARPTGDVLHLLISWPAAGLPDAVAAVPLSYNAIQ
ncbi:hypothetical protein [Actinoplanes sichuanensis]|uniref:Uncharacterized protein n=1 Tax=Actinoplanes sichuanensis TaxID=512349 RepID=A0ABW4AU18_9ACTN|nr:hypothetical protein [Actinoplanes sichuanensis]